MTKSTYIPLSLLLLSCSFTRVDAQSLDELLRFSQPEQGASARFKAMGNAQTALGGDLSSIAGNPAGLGFFGQSDIGLSFDFSNDINKASYFGTNSKNNVDKLGINQAAAVFHIPVRKARGSNLSSGWLNFNIGIGYHRTNNFNSTVGFTGVNDQDGYGDLMMYGGGTLGDIGWDFGMLDEDADGYFVNMTMPGNTQTAFYREKGHQSETNLSFGANYGNKFYIGGGIGFTRVNYQMNRLFMEDGTIQNYGYIFSQNPNSRFVNPATEDYETYNPLLESDYAFDDEYWSSTSGNGFNAKLGVVFKPVPQFQVGVSATTPTWYSLTNDYEDVFRITNYLADGTEAYYDDPADPTYYDYNFRSPYKLSAGLAYIFEAGGLLSADIDYIDYASMSISSPDASYDQGVNDDIKDMYKGGVNFRIGGEYMIAPQLMIRAGYGYTGSPYADDEIDYSGQTVSGGLGYRISNFYVDLTYQNFQRNYGMSPYSFDDGTGVYGPVADVKNQRHNVLLSVGVKF